MKKIGLIGGITWQSTQLYYQYLNIMVAERLGGNNSCELILESVNFALVSKKQSEGQWESLHTEMAERAHRLEVAGAQLILICANTMHLSVPAIEARVKVPVLHIARATGVAATVKGCKKVLLLGTRYTMEMDFYKNILQKEFKMEVMIPAPEDRDIVHKIIYTELAKGVLKDASREDYLKIIEKAEKKGAQGVILGCTEIPLLIKQEDCALPVFDTTKIHAMAALDFALEQDK